MQVIHCYNKACKFNTVNICYKDMIIINTVSKCNSYEYTGDRYESITDTPHEEKNEKS